MYVECQCVSAKKLNENLKYQSFDKIFQECFKKDLPLASYAYLNMNVCKTMAMSLKSDNQDYLFCLCILKSSTVKKATNQTPFFASTAILEMNFLIR